MSFKSRFRKAGETSKRDFALQSLRFVALFYQAGYTLYIPVAKYHSLPRVQRYVSFSAFVASSLCGVIIPYIPKTGQKKWARVEASRLRSTNVAISQMTGCIRDKNFNSENFSDVAWKLLVAVRLEVEGILLDAQGMSIDATLLTEDPDRSDNLLVRSRANADRLKQTYPKLGMHAWAAMVDHRRRYIPDFLSEGKSYRCILVFPLVIVKGDGKEECIGALSIDSGKTHDFDDLEEQIETKLLPYVSLLKLLLSMQQN